MMPNLVNLHQEHRLQLVVNMFLRQQESSVDSEHISVISRPSSVGSKHISVVGDSVITLPTQGTVTAATTRANTPVFSGGASPGSMAEFLQYWLVLFIFTLCVTYFGMMITFLAPLPTLAAFAVSIVTSMWVSASGVVVVLSDMRFYRWMYWSNPFQFAMNVMTSISFYCNTKECAANCGCPRFPDGSYVWDKLALLRSLDHGRMDTDILKLSAMCVLFASLAFIFFIVLKHNSPPQSIIDPL
ncbi:hypothetical protein NC651_029531 [Populus alba x Populus x berolinensis]|nr:hypothetical protein NC651_029531 [Populus alba x Populus x berolinensis]